jgi:hypothetical protein
MAGTSTEATLELWACSPRDVKMRLHLLLRQEHVASSAWKFLDALFGNEPRETGWRCELCDDTANRAQDDRALGFAVSERVFVRLPWPVANPCAPGPLRSGSGWPSHQDSRFAGP